MIKETTKMNKETMQKNNIHIPVKSSFEINALRRIVKNLSNQKDFRYRIRERRNRSGKYASVTLRER